jgi:polysaccharide deacetylase 2 family uncharacterized protein YibQ
MAQKGAGKKSLRNHRRWLIRGLGLSLLFLAGGGLGAGGVWLWWLSDGDKRAEVVKVRPGQQPSLRNQSTARQVPQVNPTVIRQLPKAVRPKPKAAKLAGPRKTARSNAKSKIQQRAKIPRGALASAAWRKNAVKVSLRPGQPMIAVVIDDMGLKLRRAMQAIKLPAPLTIAVLPYGEAAAETALAARRAGHEVLVHLPMQPENDKVDPGPYALLLGLSEKQLRRRLNWNLSRFSGYVGINNHMGSKFTGDKVAMTWMLAQLSERGLLFLDSYTSVASLGGKMARELGIASAVRDIFIDHDLSRSAIKSQLDRAAKLARQNGAVILIGHPHGKTIRELAIWIAAMKKAGMQFVPVSTLVTIRVKSGALKHAKSGRLTR